MHNIPRNKIHFNKERAHLEVIRDFNNWRKI